MPKVNPLLDCIVSVKSQRRYEAPRLGGIKQKGMYYSLLSHKMIPFGLFPQALQPSMNFFNISRLVYWTVNLSATEETLLAGNRFPSILALWFN